jgi:hypothetical protein
LTDFRFPQNKNCFQKAVFVFELNRTRIIRNDLPYLGAFAHPENFSGLARFLRNPQMMSLGNIYELNR